MTAAGIRPFDGTDDDYEAIVAVRNAVWPEFRETVPQRKHKDEIRDRQYFFERFVAEADGRVVAFGAYFESSWSHQPGKFEFLLNVHPEFRCRGIATDCYNYILSKLRERVFVKLVSGTFDDRPEAVRFLEKRGFRQVGRYPKSQLDVPSFDAGRFKSSIDRMAEIGIEILTLTELKSRDSNWLCKFWDLDWEISQDVPSSDPMTRQSFETFKKRLETPWFCPDANMIAVDGDRYVGLSGLVLRPADAEILDVNLTGVVRSHRRRGIATAMKVRAIQFARRHGARTIVTFNEQNNAMLALNLQLGFRPAAACLDFERSALLEGG